MPEGEALPIPGAHRPGLVTKAGLVLFGNDDRMVAALPCRIKDTLWPILGLLDGKPDLRGPEGAPTFSLPLGIPKHRLAELVSSLTGFSHPLQAPKLEPIRLSVCHWVVFLGS